MRDDGPPVPAQPKNFTPIVSNYDTVDPETVLDRIYRGRHAPGRNYNHNPARRGVQKSIPVDGRKLLFVVKKRTVNIERYEPDFFHWQGFEGC